MRRIKQKLKSQSGASITFALLLFLVCSVVSSIVIVAGTTAAGRMDQLAESDQRYYAVTSAAHLLKDIMVNGGQPEKVLYTLGSGEVIAGSGYSLRKEASEKLAQAVIEGSSNELINQHIELNNTDHDIEAKLDCTIQETLDSSGLLTFLVENTTENTGSGEAGSQPYQYRLIVKFTGNVTEHKDSTPDNPSKGVTWSFHSITKAFAGVGGVN